MQQPAAYRKAALNAGKAALNAGAIIETIDRTSRCASHRLRSRLPPDPGHRGVTFVNGTDGDICIGWTQSPGAIFAWNNSQHRPLAGRVPQPQLQWHAPRSPTGNGGA